MKVMQLIRAYMSYGHLKADLDPLQLDKVYTNTTMNYKFKQPSDELKKILSYKFYGLIESDLDREFYVDVNQLGGILSHKKNWVLRDLIKALENAYCQKVGLEY
mmetsp:Transcript_10024/g.16852  ORF Transcript_10024/g.16852 Transcript_10024/m.16852 type:complete len:104 (+) Transcript_10024:516-827(+)